MRLANGKNGIFSNPRKYAHDLFRKVGLYKSCGIIVNVTSFEPGWEGYAVLEISNTTPLPAKIYAIKGNCTSFFFEGKERCLCTYADKNGKYRKQMSMTLPLP